MSTARWSCYSHADSPSRSSCRQPTLESQMTTSYSRKEHHSSHSTNITARGGVCVVECVSLPLHCVSFVCCDVQHLPNRVPGAWRLLTTRKQIVKQNLQRIAHEQHAHTIKTLSNVEKVHEPNLTVRAVPTKKFTVSDGSHIRVDQCTGHNHTTSCVLLFSIDCAAALLCVCVCA